MKQPDWKLSKVQPVFHRAKAEAKYNLLKQWYMVLPIFGGTILISTLIQAFVIIALSIFMVIVFGDESFDALLSGDTELLLMLFLCAVPIVISVLYCLLAERRSLRSMGFTARCCIRDYLVGIAVALAMMGGAVGLAWLGGGLEFTGFTFSGNAGMLLLFVIGWMIQGLSEEVVYRSHLMISLGMGANRWVAIGISAVIFAAAHLGNDGITLFSVVNLTLYGIVAALYYLRTDSVWGIAAMHSFWNCAQGNLFGQKVSGIVLEANLFTFTQKEGYDWLHGGSFGPEGGAAVTLMLLIGLAVLLLLPQRESSTSAVQT